MLQQWRSCEVAIYSFDFSIQWTQADHNDDLVYMNFHDFTVYVFSL